MGISQPILATPADGAAIGLLHFKATKDSELTKLVYGTADMNALADYFAATTPLSIARRYNRYLYVKDTETDEIISYVNWVVPHTVEEDEAEALEFKAVVDALKAEGKFPARVEGLNLEVNSEFGTKINTLRQGVLGYPFKPHFLCDNLATSPDHRRRGAATALMKWPFEQADAQGVICYLDTDPEGPAIGGYKKIGFQERGTPLQMDIEKFGAKGIHYHVGMVREPARKK